MNCFNRHSHRIIFTIALLFFIGELTGQQKPNVIIVITDDQGYGEVAVHGNNILETPNLDVLHGESVRLTDYHVDPTCSPTRSALLTGHYSRRAGVWHTIAGRSMIRHDQVTMAQVLSNNGYATAMFGKWHLGDNYPMRPEDVGFQHVVAHKGGGVGQGPDYYGNDYGVFNNNTDNDTYFINSVPQEFDGFCTDIWFDEAIKFIETNKDEPFFVYLSTNAAHGPFNVDSDYSGKYQNQGVNANFYGLIDNIDENMGRLMARLTELSLVDNTILIFTTDNGSASPDYNAGMRGQKGSMYEGGHRVPFFIRWPAGQLVHGTDLTNLTAHIDIFPSILAMADIPVPLSIDFDGMDISPWLKGQEVAWPERVLVVESQRIQTPVRHRQTSVMKDNWRWVNNGALYDIADEPGQQTNVESGNQALVSELQAAYDTWWDDVSSRDDEYVEIVLGARQENPTTLMSHDWHPDNGETTPWNQSHVNSGNAATGWYAVNVVQAGTYQVSLRRWPVERGGELEFGNQARLKIGETEWTENFNNSSDEEVVFEIELTEGSTTLEAWLTDTRAPFYVYVQRLTGCMDAGYQEFDSTATVPDPAACVTVSIENRHTKAKTVIHSYKLYISETGKHTITFRDTRGRLVHRVDGYGKTTYLLSDFELNGIHMVTVRTASGSHTRQMLLSN